MRTNEKSKILGPHVNRTMDLKERSSPPFRCPTFKAAVDPLCAHVCLLLADGLEDLGVCPDLWIVNLSRKIKNIDVDQTTLS